MQSRSRLPEADALEHYRIALENVLLQPEIASEMAELGYGPETIAAGKTLLDNTRQAYGHNQTEDNETSAAYEDFLQKKEGLAKTYRTHRKKAKVVFRKTPLTADRLGITAPIPKSHSKCMENYRKFYIEASADTATQTKLATIKVTADDIAAGITAINEIETARATYLREKGESQQATKAKDQAFSELDDWMTDFFAVARIALEEKPQLLEALSETVPS
ncbi:hypothetical protein FUAX_25260 [Fulvitalea axinellae]|uniref:Uncharacterized protein n=1 Tax=Fulvitalea axinellae TaxID=1182444 RepID=A0AAU9CDB9_9BACT|nr:hypothetical protein FUAX_25260 [Fulvitalea axinellae]